MRPLEIALVSNFLAGHTRFGQIFSNFKIGAGGGGRDTGTGDSGDFGGDTGHGASCESSGGGGGDTPRGRGSRSHGAMSHSGEGRHDHEHHRNPGDSLMEHGEHKDSGRGRHHKPGGSLREHFGHPGAAFLAGHGGNAEAAVDDLMRHKGQNEHRDRAALKQYLRTGGHGLDPATTAWCAAAVGAALSHAGAPSLGSNVATSYMRWGDPVKGAVHKGDVLVESRGRAAGQPGGHIGFATGRSEGGRVEMLAGNASNRVGVSWVRRGAVTARRQHDAMLNDSDKAAHRRAQFLPGDPGAARGQAGVRDG